MAAMSGVIRSATRAVTTAAKARPITIPTAMSTRFPRSRNALNSCTVSFMTLLSLWWRDHVTRTQTESGYHLSMGGWSETTLEALHRKGLRNGGARRAVIELLAEQDCCL